MRSLFTTQTCKEYRIKQELPVIFRIRYRRSLYNHQAQNFAFMLLSS